MDVFAEIYRANHEALAMQAQLLVIATPEPPRIKEISDFRRDMTKKITQRVARKDQLAVAPLRNSDDPTDRALARRYTDELLRMRQAVADHHNRWSLRAIAEEPREYRLALRWQLRRMQEHVTWEEAELLPAAKRLLNRCAEANGSISAAA